MKNFRLVDDGIDVSKMLAAITPEMWDTLTFRQNAIGTAHRHTKTIYLRMPTTISVHSIFDDLSVINYPIFETFKDTIAVPLEGDSVARVMLVKLPPGRSLMAHIDEGPYAEATNRYHLPIQTNLGVTMWSGNEIQHMATGELWWFNTDVTHTAMNRGETDRIHLIIDAFKNAEAK